MKRKDDLKIDALSGIDDRFVDKVSARRYKLLSRKRFPKWIIPSSVAAAVLVAIMIPVLLMLLIKQVPIYEGMTVLENYNGTSSASIEPERRGNGFDFLSDKKDNNGNGNKGNGNGDNGNHYGQNKKPIDEIIEDDSSISLEIPDQKMYYANPNQDIYINVHISNPDSFEILSFTLNGKKYSSYMFEDGSDMENLILKVNVGDTKGVIEYTIDAIKYVDGTEIKDVIMDGERTIKVGVYTPGIQPTASTTNEFVGINEVSFDVDLSDKFELIKRCGGKAYAIVADGDIILSYKELTPGYEHISFNGLETSTSYRYGIVAYYDAFDGSGMDVKVLCEKEFTTQSVVAIDDVDVSRTGFDFDIVFNEIFESKTISSLTLYHGENKVKEFDVSGDVTQKRFSASNLLSNNLYRVEITYENDGKAETVAFEITTDAKATPDVTVTEIKKDQDSFKLDITVTDVDAVGSISNIELIHGDDIKNITDLATREFTDLLSNNDYTVMVTYTYDLNDGAGKKALTKELSVKTEAKAEPVFTFKDITAGTYEIDGSYDQRNADNTLISYNVSLYKGNELVKENIEKKIRFDSLDYYTDYTVKITYTFDLTDANGVQTKIAERSIKTLPYIDVDSTMIVNKKEVYFDGDSATLRINVDNPLAVSVKSVIIDGKIYEVSDSSTSRMILVDISDVGILEDALIEGFVVSADGVDYTVNEITSTAIDIHIISKPVITSWALVNENFEPLEYITSGQKAYILISAEKLEDNTITDVYLGFPYGEPHDEWSGPRFHENDIKMLDGGRFYVELRESDPVYFDSISVMYSNSHIEKGEVVNDQYDQSPCIKLKSNEVRYISTPEEFIAMENGYRYELTCDLDFSTVEDYSRNYFYGIIDGKGHSIKNYLIMQNAVNEGGGYAGIFWELNGIMQNINFVGFTYTEKFSSSESRNTATGVIGHLTDSGIIRNCSLDKTSEFVTANASYIGSICGRNDGIIENCSSYAKITSYAEGGQGGICGVNGGVIDNCINYTSFARELALSASGICSLNEGTVKNCTNNSDISGVWRAYGISVGGTIQNCENNGSLQAYEVCGISVAGTLTNCVNNGDLVGIAYSEFTNSPSCYEISCNGTEINCKNNGTVTIKHYNEEE